MIKNKKIDYSYIDVSRDRFSKSNGYGNTNLLNVTTSLGNTVNNSILKKEKKNKNDNLIEFRNEIKSILNEFKQFPEKVKNDLKNEIINEVTLMSRKSEYDNTVNLERENINLFDKNTFRSEINNNNQFNQKSPSFSSINRDNTNLYINTAKSNVD